MKTIFLKIAGITLLAVSLQAAAAEVSLIKVKTTITGDEQTVTVHTIDKFTVLVDNLSPQKQVFIHTKQNNIWKDLPLKFDHSVANGKEVWTQSFERPHPTTTGQVVADLEFDVKYQVNGKTYWDNNNGNNYLIQNRDNSGGTILFATNVSLDSVRVDSFGQMDGLIDVKNLASNKQIKVVYSTDNWATVKTASATFSGIFSDLKNEEWHFILDVNSADRQVVYAISYTVNGNTYWDNNFGVNYYTILTQALY